MWRQLLDATPINACKALEQAIRDEKRPAEDFCVICFLAVPGMVLEMDGPEIAQQKIQCHGLWDACMRNLCVPRTPDDLTALRQRLQNGIDHCSDCREGQVHSPVSNFYDAHTSDPPDPLELFRMLPYACLVFCLCGTDSSSGDNRETFIRSSSATKRFRSSRGNWPVTIAQLLPYGAESTVDALIESCCQFMDISALWVFTGVLNLSRPRIWDIILTGRNHRRLAWCIVTTILLGISSAPEHLEIIASCAPPGYTVPSNATAAGWFLKDEVRSAIVIVLDAVSQGPYRRPDDVLRLVGIDLALFERVMRIAAGHYRAVDPSASRCFQQYHAVIGMHVDTAAFAAGLPRHVEAHPRGDGILLVLRSAIASMHTYRYCAWQGCDRSMLELAGEDEKPLPLCSRCHLARYCSQECQRNDWRAGTPTPHKKMCPLLGQMRDILLPSPNLRDYVRCMQQSSIPDADLVLLAKWALSRGQWMRDLFAFSIAFPAQFDIIYHAQELQLIGQQED